MPARTSSIAVLFPSDNRPHISVTPRGQDVEIEGESADAGASRFVGMPR